MAGEKNICPLMKMGTGRSTDLSGNTRIQNLNTKYSLIVFLLTSLKLLFSYYFNPANEKWLERRMGSPQISNNSDKAPKPSTSVGSDPAFLSQSEQEIESVHWKLSWHFPPLLLPLSSWVRLPRELLWWLIDFNHITRLQKSGQRMKVLGNTTPRNPHTHLNIYSCSDAYDAMLLKGGTTPTSLKLHVFPCNKTNRDPWEKFTVSLKGSQQNENFAISRPDTASKPPYTSLFKCSAWKTFACLYQYVPPKPHEWAISIGLLLLVGVKRICFFSQKWLVERAIGNVHMNCDDNVHQISV